MIKFLLCGVLVFSATMLGNWFSQKLFRRTRFLQSMVEGINRMKTNVCFGSLDVYRAISESFPQLVDNSKSELSANKSIDLCWNEIVEAIPKSSGLKVDDKELLKGFGQSLGITDTQGQINNCELYAGLISERLRLSKEEEITKSRLYKVLGFSLGFVITLLIV